MIKTAQGQKTWTVCYRIGDRSNFKWKRIIVPFTTRAEADEKRAEFERMNYKSLVYDTEKLNAIGMPDTFEAGDPVVR